MCRIVWINIIENFVVSSSKRDNQEANKDAVNTLELIINDKRITQYTITNCASTVSFAWMECKGNSVGVIW